MNVALIIVAAVLCFVAAYRWVGRFLSRRLEVRDDRPTPAVTQEDGVDYVPTKPLILFGHHFSSIAGAGPIVGPIIAGLAFGWLPALLWIVLGSIFVGGVHDFASLMASIRHQGRTVGQICKQYLSPSTYYMFLIFTWMAMIYVIIVFLDLTATTFTTGGSEHHGGTVATASVSYVVIAVLFGLAVYRLRVSLLKASLVFVPLVFAALWLGDVMPLSAGKNTWSVLLLAYCFAASVLPVWLLLQPRDYLSSYLLFACLAGGIAGAVISGPTLSYPAFTTFRDAQLGYLYPAIFITIACGAISGFHSIVASGTTAKQLDRERSARPVAYGAMLTEGVLAVLALATVMVLAGKPAAGTNPVAVFAGGVGKFVSVFGVREEFGATFGLLAVSTFLLTTLDTCTRLARFIFQELTGAGRFVGTFASLIIPGIMIFVEIPGPQGQPVPAWKAIWPAFGATNQLLGALALLVVFTWLRSTGRRATYIFVPMLFMCVTTLTALAQLTWQNLAGGGSGFVGGVSLALGVLAVAVIANAFWRLRKMPVAVVPVTETVEPGVS
jgi:carbon starvation protein